MTWKKFRITISPLSIVVFYACVGGIWLLVVFSDIVSLFFHDRTAITMLKINNSVFILVTAAILYLLIQKSEAKIKQRKDALTRLNRSLTAYSQCHQTLFRAVDEMQLMQDICRTIVEVGGYLVAWVGVAEDDEEKTVRPVAQWGDERGYLKNLKVCWSNTDPGRGPTGIAIRSGEPVVAQYIEYDPKWELWREEALDHGFRSSISVPLIEKGRPFAALVIFSGEARAFDDDEVKLLSELADDLSYGISNLRSAREQQRAEKERQLLASVIEQSLEGIFLFNGEGVIQYVNPAVETITGRPPQTMIGENIQTLETREPNKKLYDAILKAITHGKMNAGRFHYKREDGVMFEIDLTIWPVYDQRGAIISYAALIWDITHEMQLERQLRQAQRMEAIGTLAGGIAHDFNNTLASIITCTEMAIEDAPAEGPLQELLDVILNSGLRGKNLVKQILSFSRQGEQEKQEVRVELVAGECLKLLRASLPPSIKISFSVGRDLRWVFADPTQIQQIIMNLCTNAVHAMRNQPHGVMEIRLENVEIFNNGAIRCCDLPPGHYLRLTVKDSGHGMDKNTQEQIFDPFFTTKGQSEGTGLGLSVIHKIVTNHGGAITVESELGEGAVFDVYLPGVDPGADAQKEERSHSTLVGSEHILLVDDEEEVVFSAQRMLKRLGYEVNALTDPRQALELFRSRPGSFDLVITDHSMPDMNGTELARELTRIRPDIPVILCTGYDLVSSTAEADGETASFISELAIKPLQRDEMAALIRRVLTEAGQEGTNG